MFPRRFETLCILTILVVYFSGVVVVTQSAPKTEEIWHLSGLLDNTVLACELTCSTTEECTQDTCLGRFGVCHMDNKCTCNETLSLPVPDEEGQIVRCLAKGVHIRDPCEVNEQCVGDPGSSTCTKTGVCECTAGHLPSAKFDDCLGIQNTIGGPCKESQQCTLGKPGSFSECTSDGKCMCTTEGVTHDDGDFCYQRATLIGQECEVDSQCSANLVLSHCLNDTSASKCQCWPNAVRNRNGTRCHNRKNLGEVCELDGECQHLGFVECLAGADGRKCECEPSHGRNPSNNNSTCMKWAEYIGESCRDHESQCKNLQNATCSPSSSTCLCNSTTHVASKDGKSCLVQKMLLNDTCEEAAQCQVVNSNCTSTANTTKCTCATDYVAGVESPNICLPVRDRMYYSCEEDVQCRTIGSRPGTVPCYQDSCQCPPPQNYHNDLCIAPLNLNQTCNLTEECVYGGNNNTWCAGKTGESDSEKWCQCKGANMAIVNGVCWQKKRVGDECLSYSECAATIDGSVECLYVDGTGNRICSCESLSVPDNDGFACVFTGSASLNMQINRIGALLIALLVTLTKFLN